MRLMLGGNITVVTQDMWYAQVRAARAFRGGLDLGASAGNYSLGQVWNPAASGVTVLVRRVLAVSPGGGRVQSSFHNAALATNVGAAPNVLVGGAASVAMLRTGQIAAWPGTIIDYLANPTGDPFDWATNWACEIPVGFGLVLGTYAVNQSFEVSFEWIEL